MEAVDQSNLAGWINWTNHQNFVADVTAGMLVGRAMLNGGSTVWNGVQISVQGYKATAGVVVTGGGAKVAGEGILGNLLKSVRLGNPLAVIALALTPTKIAEDTESEKDPWHISYRAPHGYELPVVLSVGFKSVNYPGHGLYLTWDKIAAGKYANAYGAGVLEIHTRQSVINRLVSGGFIQRDALVDGAFNILPGGIDIFNESSTIRHIQQGSYELYDQFNAQ